jgi:hypothetical protein
MFVNGCGKSSNYAAENVKQSKSPMGPVNVVGNMLGALENSITQPWNCGEEHNDLGTKKVFVCPKCKWTADRDANGARNILLRSIGNATVSKDGLDALVMEVDEVHERLEFETNKESNVIDLA